MYGARRMWMAGAVAAMAMAGCGNEDCDKLGTHMAEVVVAEAKAAGGEVAADKQAEIAKKTAEACAADPPPKEHLECAIAAGSTKAMKKCEGVDEDAEKEG